MAWVARALRPCDGSCVLVRQKKVLQELPVKRDLDNDTLGIVKTDMALNDWERTSVPTMNVKRVNRRIDGPENRAGLDVASDTSLVDTTFLMVCGNTWDHTQRILCSYNDDLP